MQLPTPRELALLAGLVVALVLISWLVFDRPLGNVLASAAVGIVAMVCL
jgi:type II secretory pathway component PulM